jgi:hypothetical protein
MILSNDGTLRGTIGWNLHLGAAAVHIAHLRRRNRTTREPIIGNKAANVNVSLTSYGKRISKVWLAIESIGLGAVKPRRVILWLADEEAVANPSDSLRRLQDRGLEIRHCRDYGPHKKYFPYVSEVLGTQPDVPLVTADDDAIYPVTWLAELMKAHRHEHVTAFRARIRTAEPYRAWPLCETTEPSERVFATGVSGVAYPVKVLAALRARGDQFMSVCPRADDFWLHYAAVATGTPVRQVRNEAAEWWSNFSMIASGLCRENITANDQISSATRHAWLDVAARPDSSRRLKVAF